MIGEPPRVVEDDEKNPAPERYSDYHEVEDDCQAMISADQSVRAGERAAVDRQLDGNRPYSYSWLKSNHQGWRANVGHRGLEGYLLARQTPLYDMTVETSPVVKIGVDWGKGQEQRDAQDAIAESFTWLMFNRWPSFDYHIQLRIREMLAHGPAYHVWPEKTNNWIPRTLRNGSVLFPEDTPLNFDEAGERFMIRDWLPAHTIYNFIRNEGAARKLGWKPDQVWKLLAYISKNSQDTSDPQAYQRRVRQGDIGATLRMGAWINWLFVKEFEGGKDDLGGITLYAVGEKNNGPTDFLFRKQNCFDEWPLTIFTYDIGNGIISGCKGLGTRTKDFFALCDRINNAMADQVMISAYPQIRQITQNTDPDKLKLLRLNALSILPYGVEPSLIQFPPLSNGPIALLEKLKQDNDENNRAYSASAPEPVSRETAFSYSVRAQEGNRIGKGTHNHYYRTSTLFYEQILNRIVKPDQSNQPWAKMAREFRERCKKKGAPQEALNKIVEIEASRAIGMGSAALRLQVIQMLMQFIHPNTDEKRKIAIERALTVAAVGYSEADSFARNVKDNEIPNSEESFATLESGLLAKGGDAQVAPTQPHVPHAQNHLGKAMEIVQALQQGQIGPEEAYVAVTKLGQHTAEHLQQLKGNPMREAEVKALEQELTNLGRIADQLAKMIQDQQDEPPPEQPVSDNLQIGMAKVEADSQVKEAKFQTDSALKFRKAAFQERLADAKTAAQINRQKQLQLTR